MKKYFQINHIKGIIFFVVPIVATYIFWKLEQDNPGVTIETLYEFDILNIENNIEDLEVLFKEENILKTGKSLKILHISITNTGNMDIKSEDFDKSDPWKLQIANSEMVKVTRLSASDSYLEKQLMKINITDRYNIELPSFMFDKKAFFSFRIIVLHKNDIDIKPVMLGKISGIKDFTYINQKSKENNISQLFLEIFPGGMGEHSIRFFFYFFCFLVFSIILEILFKMAKNSYKKLVGDIRGKKLSQKFSDITKKYGGQIIGSIYLSDGVKGLEKLKNNLSPDILKFTASAIKININYYKNFNENTNIVINTKLPSDSISSALISLVEKGILHEKDNDWKLKEDFRKLLDNFIKRLKSNA